MCGVSAQCSSSSVLRNGGIAEETFAEEFLDGTGDYTHFYMRVIQRKFLIFQFSGKKRCCFQLPAFTKEKIRKGQGP